MARTAALLVANWIGSAIVAWLLGRIIEATSSPSPLREQTILLMWPLVVLGSTAIALAYILRSPTRQASQSKGGSPLPLPMADPKSLPTAAYERLADGRMVYNVTFEQLTGFFKDQTTAQGNRLVQPWLGKLMRFTGTVFNVNEYEGRAIVSMNLPSKATGLVFAGFSMPELISRVAVLRRGDPIAVIGRISQVEPGSVSIDDCEFV